MVYYLLPENCLVCSLYSFHLLCTNQLNVYQVCEYYLYNFNSGEDNKVTLSVVYYLLRENCPVCSLHSFHLWTFEIPVYWTCTPNVNCTFITSILGKLTRYRFPWFTTYYLKTAWYIHFIHFTFCVPINWTCIKYVNIAFITSILEKLTS